MAPGENCWKGNLKFLTILLVKMTAFANAVISLPCSSWEAVQPTRWTLFMYWICPRSQGKDNWVWDYRSNLFSFNVFYFQNEKYEIYFYENADEVWDCILTLNIVSFNRKYYSILMLLCRLMFHCWNININIGEKAISTYLYIQSSTYVSWLHDVLLLSTLEGTIL